MIVSRTVFKTKLSSAPWLLTPPLQHLFKVMADAGYEARIVGGAVRNALIGKPIKDIDLATTAEPAQTTRAARDAGLSVYPTGAEHGTVTVVVDGQPFEVTTLRRDVATDGRHAVVAFSNNWNEDARRRDFTINALYASADGTIFDPEGGLEDLRKRRVRFIGDAIERIREDYLRILRFFRFSAAYGNGQLDPAGLKACHDMKHGLRFLSAERIHSELLRLLAAPYAAPVVSEMARVGILSVVLPGASNAPKLARLASIERTLGEPPDPLTGLAALAVSDPSDVDALAATLKLSNAEVSALEATVSATTGLDAAEPEIAAKACLYQIGPDAFRRAVRLAWAGSTAAPADARWKSRALLPDRWKAPAMPFSGADVLALGIAPGPTVGAILKTFEASWVESGFPADPDELKKRLDLLAKTAGSRPIA